jgi:hypothetical protein
LSRPMDRKNKKDRKGIHGSRHAKRRQGVSNPLAGAGFADIAETPDVAVWAKEKRAGLKMPSDKVAEGRVTSPPRSAGKNAYARRTAAPAREERLVDVANTREVEEAARRGEILTDKADLASP